MSRLVLGLLALVPSVLAGLTLTHTDDSSTGTSVACTTFLAHRHVREVPTSSTTVQLPAKVTLIIAASTPTLMVTPKPITEISTEIVQTTETTTAYPESDTFSTTLTETVTVNKVLTLTFTEVHTITESSTSNVVSTVPTPDGFSGVKDSSGYALSDTENLEPNKADSQIPMGGSLRGSLRESLVQGASSGHVADALTHPVSVLCE